MPNTETQLAVAQEPSVALMLSKIIEGGVTEQNVAVLERMCGLYERMEAKRAEQDFAAAFVAFQREMPEIVAQSVIPNRGKYERFEDVLHVAGPLLRKNGFAVSFEQHADDKRITVICHLMHIGGHATHTPFAVRLGLKADSDTQADCKASTTAKRNALLQALNIVIRQDYLQDEDDARIEGGYITPKEAADLAEWVEAVGANKVKFLEYAGAETFETIHTSRLESLHAELRRAEKRNQQAR